MPNGFWDRILKVDLSRGTVEVIEPGEAFFRMYLGGASIGATFLLKETAPDTDPLSPANVVTIAPSVTTGARVSGASRCSVSALSPLTNAVGDGQAGGNVGPMLKRAGVDALVVTGKADKPVYLYVEDGQVEIRDAGHLWGKRVLEVLDVIEAEHEARSVSIIQCGPAGERLVRFANLMVDHNDAVGRTGMGAVFGSKHLRAVVVKGTREVPFADPDALKELNRLAGKRRPDAGFPTVLHKHGTPGVFSIQAEGGNIAVRNFSRSWRADHRDLDGGTFEPEFAAGGSTCWGCIIGCRKRVKIQRPEAGLEVTERLGGPEFETLGLLGSNLEIMDPAIVAKGNEICNDYGLDTSTAGGLIAYLMESTEEGLIDAVATGGREVRFGDGPGMLWLLEQIVARQGVGDVLAEGYEACVQRFGEATRPFAIHVKGQAPAIHMAQVKPSQSILYAVSPIGADHQSSEHDWLLGSQGEDRKGLGIVGEGDRHSTNLAKVRMTVYSQYYYGLLDSLTLCQFVWGPGNLFTYPEFERLVQAATGWQITMWELMKAGERRANLLRQVNARRGFTRADDVLPARLFEPLPDGPAQGKHVEAESFARMLDWYYGFMGWDRETGNPSEGKLLELGLDWAL